MSTKALAVKGLWDMLVSVAALGFALAVVWALHRFGHITWTHSMLLELLWLAVLNRLEPVLA